MKNVWKEKYWNHVKVTVEDTYTKEIFKKSNDICVFILYSTHFYRFKFRDGYTTF